MAEIMSVAVSGDDQWLVVNGRSVEYYSSDTAFIEGRKVWAAERAAMRLAEALSDRADAVDFSAATFPNAVVTLSDGRRLQVDGGTSLGLLGLEATDPNEIGEDEVIILARELVTRARNGGAGVEAVADTAAAAV